MGVGYRRQLSSWDDNWVRMKEIKFHKLVASGNDFIVIDNRKKTIKNQKGFAQKVCRPHLGVGADGVLFIEPSKKADFFMRIINSDGSEAEACGNGYRCVGLYATQLLKFPRSMTAETLAGPIEIQVGKETIKVKMADPSEYKERIHISGLSSNGSLLNAAFINTGVPHTVIFTENLDALEVEGLGRQIRHHDLFKPRGTNVNFVEVTGKNSLTLRTYERGVEAETLACGTGTVASAAVACLTGRVKSPVVATTKSGETLTVFLDRSGNKIQNVFLEGGANFVFEGKIMQ